MSDELQLSRTPIGKSYPIHAQVHDPAPVDRAPLQETGRGFPSTRATPFPGAAHGAPTTSTGPSPSSSRGPRTDGASPTTTTVMASG